MPFLLDTVICSAFIKAPPGASIHTRLIQYGGQLCVSQLSRAELYALGYAAGEKRIEEIDELLKDMKIVEFDQPCALEYGWIHFQLARRGISVGRADLMIAATALVNKLVLVTHDSDFKPVAEVIPELQLDDWL